MKSSTAFLALAAAVNASPISKREYPWDTKESLCSSKSHLLMTAEGADQLWEETGAGDELDRQIMSQWEHEVNWVFNIENALTKGSGKATMASCGVIGGTCTAMNVKSCEEHFDLYGTNDDPLLDPIGRVSYWIFQAVMGMQKKFTMLKNALIDETIVANLLIGQMVEEFGGKEDQTGDVLKWLSAAMGLGSTIGGLVPGAGDTVSTGFDIMGGIFDIIAEETAPEEIDQGSISAALAGVFSAASKQIETTMRLAAGNLRTKEGETIETFNKLPAANKYGPWIHSPITKFFNGGWFLLDEISDPVGELIRSFSGSIQPKIANNVMKAANLRLVGDKRIGSQEDCGYATGRQWMSFKDSENYCFYLMKFDEHGMHGAKWTEAGEDVYANMAKYKLGLRDPYYRAIIDCATSGEEGLNLDNLGFNNIPVCFFDLEAFFLEHNDAPECTSNMINKSCNPIKATPIE
ncbi:hypothetical protein FLONG3_10556 [Fusarium longipes]|uniref:Uncharacterized protein n=1 Tax=Fusarium longipes TaxID=694270 RepID=A0A395RN71_9HYPO|nr:hypothetical protein FLONG3_10556 [Fusarium longipes]